MRSINGVSPSECSKPTTVTRAAQPVGVVDGVDGDERFGLDGVGQPDSPQGLVDPWLLRSRKSTPMMPPALVEVEAEEGHDLGSKAGR